MGQITFCTNQFQPSEIINSYEMKVFELVGSIFPKPYHCLVELPLQRICTKTKTLSHDMWKFWVNSRVDIVVMQTRMGPLNRKACLAIECQSHYHYSPDAQRRDSLKASILRESGIPLVYVQDSSIPRTLVFWTPDKTKSVHCNPMISKGLKDLSDFLTAICL